MGNYCIKCQERDRFVKEPNKILNITCDNKGEFYGFVCLNCFNKIMDVE